jgi:hypothetical protein
MSNVSGAGGKGAVPGAKGEDDDDPRPPSAPAAQKPAPWVAGADGRKSGPADPKLLGQATAASPEAHRWERAKAVLGADATEFASLGQSAHPEVREVLDLALEGPHARNAFVALKSLAQAGLDPTLLAALIYGCGVRRTAAENGYPALMSLGQAVRAGAELAHLSGPAKERFSAAVSSLTEGKSGPDRWTATALLLKGLGARGAQGMPDIERLAKGLSGLSRAEQVQKTALTDVDETRDDSKFDPLSFDDTPDDRPRPVGFSEAKNDGLFQRYVQSCGPTSIEVLRGEWDPIYAFDVRQREMGEGETTPDLQRDILTSHNVDRRLRLQTQFARNVKTVSGLSKDTREQLLDYYLVGEKKGALVDAGITSLRAKAGGFPTDDELDILRRYDPVDFSHNDAIGFTHVLDYLNEVAGPPHGVTYELDSLYAIAGKDASARQSPAFVQAHLKKLAAALDEGSGVLFSTSQPDHFWTMTCTRQAGAGREFFVHDVWSGISTWVKEREIVDGSFTRYFLPGKKEAFVDLFYLPKAPPRAA